MAAFFVVRFSSRMIWRYLRRKAKGGPAAASPPTPPPPARSVQAAERPDQNQDRNRHAEQPQQHVSSHQPSPSVRWRRNAQAWRVVPASAFAKATADKRGARWSSTHRRRYLIGAVALGDV